MEMTLNSSIVLSLLSFLLLLLEVAGRQCRPLPPAARRNQKIDGHKTQQRAVPGDSRKKRQSVSQSVSQGISQSVTDHRDYYVKMFISHFLVPLTQIYGEQVLPSLCLASTSTSRANRKASERSVNATRRWRMSLYVSIRLSCDCSAWFKNDLRWWRTLATYELNHLVTHSSIKIWWNMTNSSLDGLIDSVKCSRQVEQNKLQRWSM